MQSIMRYPGDEPITRERIVIARKWPQHYGGMAAFRDETNLWFYGAARLSPDYDADDRAALNAGSLFTLGRLLDEYVQVDFDRWNLRLAEKGIGFTVVSGDMIEGTITATLLERANPGAIATRRESAGKLYNVSEFAAEIALAAVEPIPSDNTRLVGDISSFGGE